MKTICIAILSVLALISCNNEDILKENSILKRQLDSINEQHKVEEMKKRFYGQYKNQSKGLYKVFDFMGETSVVITDGIIGLPYTTSYVRDGDLIRIRTDKSDLLLTVTDSITLTGQGFAQGVYMKQ